MRAAVYYGLNDLKVEDVPDPSPGPGEVLVRVAYSGICGTDLSLYFHGPFGLPTEPHPLTGAHLPQILGHEFGGWVDEVGEGVEDIEIGTLVAVNPIHGCGQCTQCLLGNRNLCIIAAFHGVAAHGGGLSERTVVKRSMVHPLPAGMGPRQAALIEPMAVSYRAVRRAEVQPGDTVLILGAGPIGLGSYFAVKSAGGVPIVSEPSPVRRQILANLGATNILDPASDDVANAVHDLTNGAGAAATVDAVANPSTFSTALSSTARGGTVVLVGIGHEPLPLDPIALFLSEISVRASNAYADDFQATIVEMASGAYPLEGWVSTIALEDIIEQGFDVLRQGDAMKILVDVNADGA